MSNAALNTEFPEFDELESTYRKFYHAAEPYLHPDNEEKYQDALTIVGILMEKAEGDVARELNDLIAMLIQGIEEYENKDEELVAFKNKAEAGFTDVAVLRLLMSQHGLTGSDFPEIGDKSYISKILNGDRNLTKKHIVKLAERFKISPSLFFD